MTKLPALSVLLSLLCATGCNESQPETPPTVPGPATFVGSQTCQNCHEAEFREWSGSQHEQAMQVANASTVLGNFAAPVGKAAARRQMQQVRHHARNHRQLGNFFGAHLNGVV